MSSRYEDGRYAAANPSWHEEDSPWKAARIAAMLKRHALQPATVAEVGCGAGGVLQALSAGWGPSVRCSGFEVSPDAFARCQGKAAPPQLQFHLADLLADDQAHFDLLLAIDVFEHVDDYLGFLRRLRGKGRHTVFHIPLDLSAQTVLRGTPLLTARLTVGHLHHFTQQTALATLRDAGYEVLDHRYTAGALDLPARHWKAALMKLPRRLLFALAPDLTVRALGGWSLLVLAR
jgi:cyclopropane fatty-acyl-phospholipid synthase-like methyltransferase